MNRVRPFAIGFALVFALGAASLAHAQTDTTHPYDGAASGVVTAVDAASISVKGPNDDGGTYAVDKDTQVMNDAKKIAVTDVKKGWTVTVSWDYTALDKKSKLAKLIEVTDTP
jgi:hypothetical protein